MPAQRHMQTAGKAEILPAVKVLTEEVLFTEFDDNSQLSCNLHSYTICLVSLLTTF